jgi:hypothetical protein
LLATFRIQDFKGHRDTEVPLGRFAVLVGDNGSGKTSVLEALWLQGAFGQGPPTVLKGDWSPEDLLRRGAAGPIRISSEGMRGITPTKSKIEIAVSEASWTLTGWTSDFVGGYELKASGGPGSGSSTGEWPRFESMVGRAKLYRLQATQIAAPAYSEEMAAVIQPDGQQTGSCSLS